MARSLPRFVDINPQRGATTFVEMEACCEVRRSPRSCTDDSFAVSNAECSGRLKSCGTSDCIIVTGRESQLKHQRGLSEKLDNGKEPPTQLLAVTEAFHGCANKVC